MSENLNLIALESATGPELDEFFHEKGVDNTCGLCKSEKWIALFEFNNHAPAIPFSEKAGAINNNIRMTIFITICENCGYARSFSKFLLHEWLLRKRGAGEKE